MGWFDDLYRIFNGNNKSDYQYDILENTPLLHDPDTLDVMYRNANKDQKASIMLHIDNFHDITHDWDDYKQIKNKIWDDYS